MDEKEEKVRSSFFCLFDIDVFLLLMCFVWVYAYVFSYVLQGTNVNVLKVGDALPILKEEDIFDHIGRKYIPPHER